MMPNTAVALLLTGAAGALCSREQAVTTHRVLSLVAASVALALGLATLAEYALNVDLHIDQLFVSSLAGPHPGRPSPPTALAFSFLAVAVLIFDSRPTARVRPSEWLILSAAFIGFVAGLGHLFGAGPLYALIVRPVKGVAVPTALSLLLTAAGLLLERPNAGIMRLATSPGPGGILLRRLAWVAIVAPILLGLIGMRVLVTMGLEDFRLVFAMLVAATTVTGLVMLAVTAIPLNSAHAALESSRARTQSLIEQASDGIFVADLQGRYVDVNGAGCEMLGYSREELTKMSILDLIPPEDAERLQLSKQQLLAGQTAIDEWRLRRKDGSYVQVEVSAKILPDGRWQGLVRDISERKRAEAQIRESQERLDLALRGADLATWDWNIETAEVIFNSRWATMRGFGVEEIRPHIDSWAEGVHPEDWPQVERVLGAHLQGQIPDYESEHRVRTKSGRWIWILDRGRVFARDANGRPLRMAGTELDITERKHAEEALRISEAKSSGIISISADAIISIDEEQRITMFNEGAERIFGYSSAEVMGAPLDVLLPERFQARHRRDVAGFAAGRQVARRMGERGAPIFGLHKDGHEFPVDAAISKLDVGGKQLLTVALRDVTEQRRLESEQRFLAEVGSALAASLEYEDTLASVARLAADFLGEYGVAGVVGEKGAVEDVKVASRDPSQAWVCDLVARFIRDPSSARLVRWALDVEQPAALQRLPPELVVWLEDRDLLSALQRVGPRSLIVVPLIARGIRLGAIALVSATRTYGATDVQLARELAHRAALALDNARLYRLAQRAVRARDEVLGVVAHDLRNPLGTVLMQVELLRLWEAESDRRMRKPAEVIERAANRMNRLIQDLLDVTRIEAGHLSLERTLIRAGQVVADSLEVQAPHAAAASLELGIEVAEDAPELWADHDRLLQVFENLIGNAIKCTAPGGQIRIGAVPRDGEVLFWIRDTGAGIASQDVEHLFDRFWQARKGERRGAGLGLPIVKGIVEAHGGRIWVDSAPGRGSTFFFTIPAHPRAEPSRAEQAPQAP